MPTSSSDLSVVAELRLRPSMRALRALFVLHAAPLLLAAVAMPAGYPMLLLAAAFAASWLWLRRHPAFGHGPRALVRLLAREDGSWQLSDAAGHDTDAQLRDDSIVTGALLVLNFRTTQGRRCSRVLLGDETDRDALRRLHALLRRPQPKPAASAQRESGRE